jgi:glycosyltransferase involved in cell wall biosynthesis
MRYYKTQTGEQMRARIGFLMNYSSAHRNIKKYSDLVWGWELIIYDYSLHLMKQGYEIFWLLYSDSALKFSPLLDGIYLIRVKKKQSWYNPMEGVRLLLALIGVVKKYRINVLYTRATFLGFIAGLSCKITKIPFIFHVEDLDASLIKFSSKSKMEYPLVILALFYQKFATLLASKIITVSKAFKDFLVTSWSIADKKIEVLYEGVEVPKARRSPKGTKRARARGLKDNAFSILYVGGTTSYDGIDILIKAFAKIVKKFKKTRLIIATFSPKAYCLHLKRLCRSLNIIERVKFLSSITGEVARSLARNCDVAVIPRKQTLSTELTTTSVIFLYISEGVPIIAPRLRAILELINGDAIFFEPENVDSLADAITQLVSNEQRRTELHLRLLQLKDKLSRERMCKRLGDIIKTLIREKYEAKQLS